MSKQYQIYGLHVINELRKPADLEATIKNAYDYTQSWCHSRGPILMRVMYENEPIVYSFGYYADLSGIPIDPQKIHQGSLHDIRWQEICYIMEAS